MAPVLPLLDYFSAGRNPRIVRQMKWNLMFYRKTHNHTKWSNDNDATIVVVSCDNPSLRIHANTHCAGMTSNGNILDKSSICLEYSDWVCGGGVGNQDVVIGINEEVPRIRKLTSANMTNKITLGIKDGKTKVVALTNSNVSIRQQAKTIRAG